MRTKYVAQVLLSLIPAMAVDALTIDILGSVGGDEPIQITEDGKYFGVGTFRDESYVEITEIEAGFRASFFVAREEVQSPAVTFEIDPGGDWIRLEVVREEVGSDNLNPLLGTEAYDTPHSVRADGVHILRPGDVYGVGGLLQDACVDAGECVTAGFFNFELTVKAIPEPLAGDVNLDNRVGFDDFLVISNNFTKGVGGWFEGDLTQDAFVDFRDFVILADNFGAVREPQLAAVPEPSCLALFGWALCGLGRLRLRRLAV